MRTTVSIHDELLAAAKERARERGVSLGTVVEDGLRRELHAPVGPGPEIPVLRGGGGFVPDIDPASNSALREYLDDGLPPEKLR